jgi:hypothetical protein
MTISKVGQAGAILCEAAHTGKKKSGFHEKKIEVGFIRLRSVLKPNSGKPEFSRA